MFCMKRIAVIIPFLFGVLFGQNQWYIAAKSGLNLREKPDPKSPVVQLIPYGKSIKTKYPENYVEFETENFKGSWWEAEYDGKKGYVFSEFVFSIPPPDPNHHSLEDYIKSFPLACGPVSSETVGTVDGLGSETTKRYLTMNGIHYYEVNGYEYGSFVCILPSFSIYRAFHLLRMFDKIKKTFGANDDFPLTNLSTKLDELETFTFKITREGNWISKIELRWEGDGYPEQINVYFVGGEIVIEMESGSI